MADSAKETNKEIYVENRHAQYYKNYNKVVKTSIILNFVSIMAATYDLISFYKFLFRLKIIMMNLYYLKLIMYIKRHFLLTSFFVRTQ